MRLFKVYLIIACLFFMSACTKNPLEVDFKPVHEPMYNFTQSSDLLSCTGKKIDKIQASPIDVYVSSIPDHTTPSIEGGFLTKDAVMMATTAVDRLNTERVAVVGDGGEDDSRKQVQIFGAFTELNRTTQSNALSGDVALGNWELDVGKDKNINHIAIDLAMSENGRVVPHTPTSVSIFIYGENGDAEIAFDNDGDFATALAYGYTGQEGFHSASRLLIETAVAIMMSSYYDLDITSCLNKSKKDENDVRVQETSYDKAVFDEEYFRETHKPKPLPKKEMLAPTATVTPMQTSNEINQTEDKSQRYKSQRPGIIDAPIKEQKLKAFESHSGQTLYNVPQTKVTRDSYGRRIVKPSAIQQIPVEPKEYKDTTKSMFGDEYDVRVATQKRSTGYLDIQNKSDLLSLLARGGISAPHTQVDRANSERVKRYLWNNNHIKGVFIKFPLPPDAKLYEYAKYYIEHSNDSCGNTAPSGTKNINYGIFENISYTSFDVTCPNNTRNIYIFYTYNGQLNILNLKRLKEWVDLDKVMKDILRTILSK